MTEHGGHHRAGQVARQRGVHRRTDHVGQPQDGQCDVGSPPAHRPGVALNVHAVPGEAVAGRASATAVLGVDHRIVRMGSIDLGGGLQHDATHRGCLLAGSEQLHGTHDVEFLERGPPARARHVGGGGRVHHSVNVAVSDHLGNQGVPDVGANELGPAHPSLEILAGRDRVDGDDFFDQRVLHQTGGEVAAQESARPRHQYHSGVIRDVGAGFHQTSLSADAGHGAVRRDATYRVFCAGPGSDGATCDASSWTCACAAS